MDNIPLISDIVTDIETSLMSGLGLSSLDKFLTVDSQTNGMILKQLFLYCGWLQNEFFPDTATSEAYGGTLERAGRIFLGRNPYPAAAGVYQVQLSGTIGATVPASTTFRSDNSSLSPGYLFILPGAFTLVTGSDVVNLTALTPGTIASLNSSDTLTCTAPLVNISQSVIVTSIVTGAIDAEDLELYRKKILQQIRLIAGSWSAIDYRLIGNNIDGVRQIYAYAYSGHANQINVWIEGTTYGSTPAGGVINNVQNATELVRPLHVLHVNYAASTVNQIVVTITGGSSFTSTQQAAVTTALTNAINVVRPFIAACDSVLTRNDSLGTDYSVEYCTNLQAVIASAIPGVPFGAVTFTVDSTPETTYTADNGCIPFLNSIVFS